MSYPYLLSKDTDIEVQEIWTEMADRECWKQVLNIMSTDNVAK